MRHIESEQRIIKGFLKLRRSLQCTKEAIEAEYYTSIAGTKVKIVFPAMPAISKQDSCIEECENNWDLISPVAFANYTYDNGQLIDWGSVIRFPEAIVNVHAICFIIELKAEGAKAENVASSLYESISEWENSLIDFCGLVSKQYSNRDDNVLETDSDFQLYERDYIPQNKTSTIHLYIANKEQSLTNSDIKNAFEFASSRKKLRFEYQLLLSSYDAKRKQNNRQVVVDACAAVEKCIIDQIQRYSDEREMDSKILLEKYKTLGDRFKLIKKIDPLFSVSDVNKRIVNVRNDMIHARDLYPTNEKTDELLRAVEQCLAFYHSSYY